MTLDISGRLCTSVINSETSHEVLIDTPKISVDLLKFREIWQHWFTAQTTHPHHVRIFSTVLTEYVI